MYTGFMTDDTSPPCDASPASPVMQHALTVMLPLVTWLLRSGVGHGEFAAALKPVFLKAARLELERIQGKPTDSALSLLSGLHRKDVRALAPTLRAPDGAARLGKPTPASQVATRWLVGANHNDFVVASPS